MRILVCGVGALGSTAAMLSRNLPAELTFVDFDRVESKNLLAQAYVKQSVGRNKAEALRLQLLNFHGISAGAFPVRVDDTNIEALASKTDLIIDAFDNLAGREVLSRYARSTGTPLVHAAISADGSFGIVRWDERFAADAEDEAGQATCDNGEHLPFIALVAAALAQVVKDYVTKGIRRDVMITPAAITTTATS